MAHLILWNPVNNGLRDATRTAGGHQLKSWLSKFGFQVVVIDFPHLMTTQQLVSVTEKFIDNDTIAIGVNTSFWQNFFTDNPIISGEPQWVLQARTILENTNSNLQWLLGGSRTTDLTREKLEFDWTMLHGYAEDSLLKFLVEKSNNNNYAATKFDIVDHDYTFANDAQITRHEVLPIEISRGCQFACSFCRFPLLGKKKGTYTRKYHKIHDEFLYNYENFGTTQYMIIDDTVNENIEKISALAEIRSKLPFDLRWIGFCRLDLIGSKPTTIDVLRHSGLLSCFFGIESFDPDASKIVGKGWNGVHGREFLLRLMSEWKNDITFSVNFIVGLGQETPEQILQTNQWCIDNKIHAWNFAGLNINRNPHLVYQSKFDKEYHNYGYRFPNPMDDIYWENGIWNTYTAFEFAKKLKSQSQYYSKLVTWRLAMTSSTVQQPMTSLMNMQVRDIDQKWITGHITDRVSEYYQGMMNS